MATDRPWEGTTKVWKIPELRERRQAMTSGPGGKTTMGPDQRDRIIRGKKGGKKEIYGTAIRQSQWHGNWTGGVVQLH